MAAPSQRDIKRLFALSSNRCAFPKCGCSIAEGTILIGEVCHIKADKAGGPRYDATQIDTERQSFDNLILMCANHHKVVDDDEEAYSVERLLRMKAAHEVAAIPPSDSAATQIAVQLLIDQSIASSGQIGGITAHTINAQTINMHSAGRNEVKASKVIQAGEALWKTTCALKAEFNDIVFLDTILTKDELDACFSGNDTNTFFQAIQPYENLPHVAQKMQRVLPPDVEGHRVFVSPRTWGLHQTLITLYGRAGMLLTLSFKENRLRDWRDDPVLDKLLRSALATSDVDAAKKYATGGLHRLVAALESALLQDISTN